VARSQAAPGRHERYLATSAAAYRRPAHARGTLGSRQENGTSWSHQGAALYKRAKGKEKRTKGGSCGQHRQQARGAGPSWLADPAPQPVLASAWPGQAGRRDREGQDVHGRAAQPRRPASAVDASSARDMPGCVSSSTRSPVVRWHAGQLARSNGTALQGSSGLEAACPKRRRQRRQAGNVASRGQGRHKGRKGQGNSANAACQPGWQAGRPGQTRAAAALSSLWHSRRWPAQVAGGCAWVRNATKRKLATA
jgi:hypothetical protein